MKGSKTAKKLTGSIIAVVVLAICLVITTFALVWATVSVDNNLFRTGSVKINLNDGKPVIEEHEFLFEPGMTVKKDFFIENESTCDVFYKLYFENVQGGLADVLEITVKTNVIRTITLSGDPKIDSVIRILISVALIVIIIFAIKLSSFLDDFLKELTSLNKVIRKTEGEERNYWKKRKKKLLRSLFLFQKYDD